MKKILSFTGILILAATLMNIPAFAWVTRTRPISNVRITVNTGDLEVGDQLSDNAESYISLPESSFYEMEDAEWLDDVESLKIGDAPRMRVYLAAIPKEISGNSYDTVYLFTGNYSSHNVRVNKGELLAADIRDQGYTLEVTIRVNPISGTYEAPVQAYWADSRGNARWEESYGDSGYYDIVCYRGASTVKKLNSYHGRAYNFYPYMTREGSYSFKVRAVPPAGSKSKSSEWIESGDLYIGKDQVSDGSGQTHDDENGGGASGSSILPGTGSSNLYPEGTGTSNVAGWISEGGENYFRYPNGEYVRDSWLHLQDRWYLFDSQGRSLRGWQQNKYGYWFYLEPSTGAMRTGWLQDGGKWYYLNDTKDSYEGCMVRGWWTWNNLKYYFNDQGVMVTGWFQIDGKYYYFYPEGTTGGGYGYMASNTRIGDFYVGADGAWTN